MFEEEQYIYEVILGHIDVCEKRFSQVKKPLDFVNSELGATLLDAIVTRLQAIGENVKKLVKHQSIIIEQHPEIEWEKVIRFRDFISHHYEMLDYEVVFDICETNLPKLKAVFLEKIKSS